MSDRLDRFLELLQDELRFDEREVLSPSRLESIIHRARYLLTEEESRAEAIELKARGPLGQD
jgi:hypothetical protein